MRAAFAESPSSERATLDGISEAFLAAMARDGGPVVIVVASAVLLALVGGLVYWVLREARRGQIERRALNARREAAQSQASSDRQRREWVRVPGHLPMTVRHPQGGHGFRYEDCETRNISGGGVAFLSRTPPPPGCPVHFTLDLGEKAPLPLRGVVVRVEAATPGAPALVALKLGPCTPGERERVVRWVAHVGERELAAARQGRPCPFCGRPMADEAGEAHSTCAAQMAKGARCETPFAHATAQNAKTTGRNQAS